MKAFRILLLLAFVMIEAGCGLPDSYYIVPPSVTVNTDETNPIFTINGTSRSGDILVTFTGYELYYKIYSAEDSVFTADENYGSSSYGVSDLTADNFYRMCRGPGSVSGLKVDTYPGTGSAPLINMAKIDSSNTGTDYTINIVFDDSTPPSFGFSSTGDSAPVSYYEYTPANKSTATEGMEVRRYVQADTSLGNVCKTFASNDSYTDFTNYDVENDDDLTYLSTMQKTTIVSQQYFYIMIYAVSYGKAEDGTAQTSYPILLGYTKLPYGSS